MRSKKLLSVTGALLILSVLAGYLALSSRDGDSPPSLVPVWTGGFESRSFDEYLDAPWNFEGNGPPKLVSRPVLSGQYAASFALNGGDRRQEIVASAGGKPVTFGEGDDLYFAFSTRFPSDWPVVRTWQVIAQWKASGAGSPPIGMLAGAWGADRFYLSAAGWPGAGSRQAHDLGPIVRDRWISWIVRIKFSSNPTKSRVEVWRDRKRVLELQSWRPSFEGEDAGARGGTLRAGRPSYLKTGIYRDPAITSTARVWMDGWMIATRG